MARIVFTQHLRRLVGPEPIVVPAATLGAALDQIFAERPQLRRYILDDQNRLRRHVAVFVDGLRVRVRRDLNDPLAADAEVHDLQALSGG